MATQPLTNLDAGAGVKFVTWSALANGDVGAALSHVEYSDVTIAFEGTFGTGGSVTLKGSMDGAHYHALSDPQGNAITLTAAGIKSVVERPRFVRPECTGGDGTTAIICYLMLGRGAR